VDDFHELLDDLFWVWVLDDVAAIDDAGGSLGDEVAGALEDDFVGDAASATDENGDTGGDFDDFVILGDVIGGIGLDDIRSEFHGLPDKVHDLFQITIDHVAAGLCVWAEAERLDHHGHSVVVGLGLEAQDVIDALGMDFGGTGDLEKVHANAGGIKPDGLEHGVRYHFAETRWQEFFSVNVRNIGAQDEGGLLFSGNGLEVARLADGELDGVGPGIDEGFNDLRHVFDSLEETGLVEEAVIDGDIEAAVGPGVEETVEAV